MGSETEQRPRSIAAWVTVTLVAALVAIIVAPGVPAAGADEVRTAGTAGTARRTAIAPALRVDAERAGTVDVLVRLRTAGSAGPAAVGRSADALISDIAPPRSIPVDVLDTMGVVSMGATPADLDQLARSPLVSRVEPNLLLKPSLERSTAQIGAPAAWQAGFSGAGGVVAVIDSGVDTSHPALRGKVKHEACFTNNSCPNGQASMVGSGAAAPCAWGDGCEHGTHVAGVIAANGEQRGVAPDAGIVAVQVFSQSSGASCGGQASCPRARTSDVLAALDHVNALAASNALNEPIVAVNLSLASDVTSPNCDDSILAAAVASLRTNNVATIVAAGNTGKQGELSIPACITATVSVGAVDQNDRYWNVSNASAALDFFAPGVNVVSAWPGGGWRAASGTSTAAPHVAGAWAVAAQALGTTNPQIIADWFRGQPKTIVVPDSTIPAIPRIALDGLAALRSAQQPLAPKLTSLVGDYDGNGYEDIYWFDPAGAASEIWWFGASGREQVTPSAMGGSWRPVSGDFNHDGVGDIIWYSPDDATYFWFGRRSRGVFEGTGPFYPYGNYRPVAGDFNGDGFDDVYLYGAQGGSSYIFWMGATPGWPGFATVAGVGIPAAPGAGFAPTAGDFDGDGDADVFWQAAGGSLFEWSNRDGSFGRVPAIAGNYTAVSANFDGDRYDDLLLYAPAPGSSLLWWGGVVAATGVPRRATAVSLDRGVGAIPVPGRFFGTGRDSVTFYGPNTPAGSSYRPQL